MNRAPRPSSNPKATYLITGGSAAIGPAPTASWMIERGGQAPGVARTWPRIGGRSAGHRGLAEQRQRSGVLPAATSLRPTSWHRCSIRSAPTMPPLRGSSPAAGILDDGHPPRASTTGGCREVMAPKLEGAWNLHSLNAKMRRAGFLRALLFRRSAFWAQPGQAHYRRRQTPSWTHSPGYRRAEGRPALSINWGPWAEVGLVRQAEAATQTSAARHDPIPVGRTAWQDAVAAVSGHRPPRFAVPAVGDAARWHNPSGSTPVADRGPARRNPRFRRLPPGRGGQPSRRLCPCAPTRLKPPTAARVLPARETQAAGKLRSGAVTPWTSNRPAINSGSTRSSRWNCAQLRLRRDLGIVVSVVRCLDGPSVTGGLAAWLVEQFIRHRRETPRARRDEWRTHDQRDRRR